MTTPLAPPRRLSMLRWFVWLPSEPWSAISVIELFASVCAELEAASTIERSDSSRTLPPVDVIVPIWRSLPISL